jgi:hypothetical protein
VNYQSIARRYLPLAAVVAVQLLIIAVVPSKANPPASTVGVSGGQVQGYSNGGGSAGGSGLAGGAAGVSAAGSPGGAATTAGLAGTTGASGAGGSGGNAAPVASATGGGSAGGTAGSASGGSVGAGSTAHCAGNREFSPSIDFYAPPCTPGPIGATSYPNGGSTYSGVTKNAITIVDYVSNYGAEVNTILQAQGLLETYQDAQVVDKAWQNFINSHLLGATLGEH